MKVFISLLILLFITEMSLAQTESINVNDEIITFKVPQGFVRQEDANVIEQMRQMTPKSCELLATFTAANSEEIILDKPPTYPDETKPIGQCSIMAQTYKLENHQEESLTLAEFVSLRDHAASEMKTMINKTSQDDNLTDQSIWKGQISDPLEKRFGTYQTTQFISDSVTGQQDKFIITMSIVLAKNQPVVFYVFKKAQSSADIEQVKAIAAQLVTETINANPSKIEDTGIKDNRTRGSLMIIGIIIIVICIAKILKKS